MADETQTEIMMKVGAGSDVRKIGSAVAHSVTEGKKVSLRCVGAGAISQAVKALAVASGWTAPRGIDLLFRPGFTDIPGREGGTISAIVLSVVVQ